MASLDWRCRRTGDVTLVELAVRSEFDARVRIESQLTPVWPPRERGVPAAGWDGATFEGTVEADRPLVLGYASPATPREPPAEITATGTPADDDPVTPREVVRSLGEVAPARDALADPPAPGKETGTDVATVDGTSERGETPVERSGGERSSGADRGARNSTTAGLTVNSAAEPGAWFETVEERLDTAEQLASAADADEARATVEELGGIEAARALQEQLESDRRQLREVRRQSARLDDAVRGVDVPLATLERIV